jgi:hypothetical protein
MFNTLIILLNQAFSSNKHISPIFIFENIKKIFLEIEGREDLGLLWHKYLS